MKEIIEVRSNSFYSQKESSTDFQLKACLELVIIHSDGKEYRMVKDKVKIITAVNESRFLVTPEQLSDLIVQLQLQQKKMDGIRKNADQLTGLVKYITTEGHGELKQSDV